MVTICQLFIEIFFSHYSHQSQIFFTSVCTKMKGILQTTMMFSPFKNVFFGKYSVF